MLDNETDWDVMDPKDFFLRETRTHLARRKLHDIFDGGEHWVFAVAPECYPVLFRLGELYAERLGGTPEILCVGLDVAPGGPTLFMPFPRQYLSLEEVEEIIQIPTDTPRDQVTKMAYLTVYSPRSQGLVEALNVWVNVDHLLN